MNPWPAPSKVRELFDAVADLPADERPRYLEEHCPDPQLRQQVERLLAAGTVDPPQTPPDVLVSDVPTHVEPATDPGRDGGFPALPGYEILARLGQGGMGVVYKARQLELDRTVAVKMIRPDVEADPEKVRRFRLEAKVFARIQHPNIVQIYEVGEHAGRPFLVLEFIEGGSLADRLDGKPWPTRDAARLVRDLARGIQEAHQREIVHRDLKPSNVLLPRDTLTPKVTDFGIAKLLDPEARQTQTGQILGTPCYMAPEQAGEGKLIGPATDVYGLGATLYELLAGKPPFQGDSYASVLDQVKNREPVPPRQLVHSVPRDLETVCLKCLEKDPARRYPSAAALAEDLDRFLTGQSVKARPAGYVDQALRGIRRRPVVSLLTTALALTVVVLAVVLIAKSEPPSGGLPAPPPPGPMRLAIKPWVGYTPLEVVRALHLEGIDLKFKQVESLDEAEGLVTAGKVDAVMWLVEWQVIKGSDTTVVLMLDKSLEADAIVARENIKHIGDMRDRKIAYQAGEPSEFMLRRLCEKTRGKPGEIRFEDLQLRDASAEDAGKWFVDGGPSGERYDAVGTYEPHVRKARKQVPGAYLLYSGAEEGGKIVDMLAVRKQYLKENRDTVKQLIRAWFLAVDTLQDRTHPLHNEALRIAGEFNGTAPAGGKWSIERLKENILCSPEEFYDITGPSQIRWGDREANRAFFRPADGGGPSEFHILFSESQKLLKARLRKERPPEEDDGSKLMFEITDENKVR
jgi:ABC-type nitrate/sulfonate/bicarbonate transport system substrate-binding protein